MNQVKIGKLIAECRKDKKITQVELADKLYVTDKSVSKWENGILWIIVVQMTPHLFL